ncbi:glutamate 5-kinase [Jeotgalibaca sp. MA1X17-3]|nr:glutamate 5-kinase [Jeotgalibaca sp. MA1X17-3]UJF15888.1 glutamate 5-kinase [Jeotgalibaca sp. MA1X17-3]
MKQIRPRLLTTKRIVIKIGTSSLMNSDGTVDYQQFDRLAYVLSVLRNHGKEIVLVSSGAIGVGMNKLGLKERPQTIPEQQAIAAVGQSEMMNIYSRFFSHYNQMVAQILMTRDIVEFPESYENAVNAFEELLQMGIIPIVNENDTVAVDELDHETKFGDNDRLSSIVSVVIHADLLIMLSDVEGFFDKNPMIHSDAKIFHTIHSITKSDMDLADGTGTSFGTGGMTTKLKAARYLLQNDQEMILAKAEDPTLIFSVLKGEKIGTYFTNQD